MKLIVFAGIIVGLLLISQARSLDSSGMEGCPELKTVKPEEFKPEMVVGRFYVESREDPAAQTLLAQSKKVEEGYLNLYLPFVDPVP